MKCKCVLCNSNFVEEREGKKKKKLMNMLFYKVKLSNLVILCLKQV